MDNQVSKLNPLLVILHNGSIRRRRGNIGQEFVIQDEHALKKYISLLKANFIVKYQLFRVFNAEIFSFSL